MLLRPGGKGIEVADPGGGLKEGDSKLAKPAAPPPASLERTQELVTLTRVSNPKCTPF